MTAFADAEARLAQAVINRLGNAVAVIGAATVSGIFDDAYADPLGIASASPALTVLSADAAGVAHGTAITVNSVSYTVAEVQPDGAGITRLLLK